ncbi:TRAP transporter substrate-binding protein DctP [Azospirillum halopraeferens]|uniref:TRAP transporter substrate-binding protein DctP n=1 Tax=Azospirillum halopraeferens TaxID=34010 RepID=UPI00040EF8EB|nr:TRAP transporter substrate-binding protein DctP [Azospirillum halopraeferens]
MRIMAVRPAVVVLLSALAAVAADGNAAAEPALLVRISTENGPTHVQTRILQRFADTLRERAAGRLTVEFHHSGTLYRDRDVVGALQQGRIEMALPGTWQLDRYEPTVGALLLPMVYGRDSLDVDRILDGSTGARLNARLMDSTGLYLPGRWVHLGFAHVYTLERPVRDIKDLQGLRIRSPGGDINDLRLEALGARPVAVPWTELPDALRTRRIDGLLSTHATVVSAELWRQGVRHAFEDRAYFSHYVPLVSRYLWDRLPPDLQDLLTATWEEQVDTARRDTAAAQEEARRVLSENGVMLVTPPPEVLASWRERLRDRQDAWVAATGMDPAIVDAFAAALDRPTAGAASP